MFYDDRRWLNPGWLFTSHRAVNKQADWGSLTTEQKDKLSALYDDYRSSKKPAPWDFARSASEYLTDTERANRFYAETIFERGVPKELVSQTLLWNVELTSRLLSRRKITTSPRG
jgi:hypothetical protein